jgi:hypothetical protein
MVRIRYAAMSNNTLNQNLITPNESSTSDIPDISTEVGFVI